MASIKVIVVFTVVALFAVASARPGPQPAPVAAAQNGAPVETLEGGAEDAKDLKGSASYGYGYYGGYPSYGYGYSSYGGYPYYGLGYGSYYGGYPYNRGWGGLYGGYWY